jgi:hypothetical protein
MLKYNIYNGSKKKKEKGKERSGFTIFLLT